MKNLCIYIYLLLPLVTKASDSLQVQKLIFESNKYIAIDQQTAILFLDSALQESETLPNKKYKATILNNTGLVYMYLGNHKKALEYFFEALKIYEKLGRKRAIANCYGNIGNIYTYQGDYTQAEHFLNKALSSFINLNDTSSIALTYANIGGLYANKYEKDTNNSNLFVSLDYHFKALNMSLSAKDTDQISTNYNNIGDVYFKLLQLDSALKYQLFSLSLNKKKDYITKISKDYNNLGNIYLKEEKYDTAIVSYKKGLQYAIKTSTVEDIILSYKGLADCYNKIKDFEKGMTYYKKFVSLKDSVFNSENSLSIANIKADYEIEKKSKQIEQEKKTFEIKNTLEVEKQRLLKNSFIVGFVLILCIAFFILKGLIQKKRANVIIEQKNKDITDSINYASHIQKALMTGDNQLKEMFNDSFVLYKPKDIVSGDFYFACEIDNKKVVVTGDCTGHGVPGALMSVMGISFLNDILYNEKIIEPAEILNRLKTKIIHSFENKGQEDRKDGIDMSVCIYDIKRNKLTYANANSRIYFYRNGKLVEGNSDKIPVGKYFKEIDTFKQWEVDLQKGDIIYTLTDGYIDQFGGHNNKKFKSKQLKEMLQSELFNYPNIKQHMAVYANTLEVTHEQWKGKTEQTDDILVIGIEI